MIPEGVLPDCVIDHHAKWLSGRSLALCIRSAEREDYYHVPVNGPPHVSRRRGQKYYNDDMRYFAEHWIGRYPRWNAHVMPSWIRELQRSVQCAVDAMPHIPRVVFNSALINWYKDGSEGISRHQDKQPTWGPTPTIAVVSLGTARNIVFEPLVVEPQRPRAMKRDKTINTVTFPLKSGDLLVMSGRTNDKYCHSIPMDAACFDQRWSVTFRMVNHDYS